MDDCLFCKIIEGKLPSKKEYDDGDFIVFHDIHPKAPVHVLIVPKKHLELKDDFESERNYLGKIFSLAKKVAFKLGVSQSGYKLIINCGRGGGQLIDHLHVHLIGGWAEGQEKKFP